MYKEPGTCTWRHYPVIPLFRSKNPATFYDKKQFPGGVGKEVVARFKRALEERKNKTLATEQFLPWKCGESENGDKFVKDLKQDIGQYFTCRHDLCVESKKKTPFKEKSVENLRSVNQTLGALFNYLSACSKEKHNAKLDALLDKFVERMGKDGIC